MTGKSDPHPPLWIFRRKPIFLVYRVYYRGMHIDPKVFEKETLASLRMPSEIVMRHRIPQFGHIFSGDDYAAGYYSYLWADVISADATEAFTVDGKGLYDKAVAKRLLDHVFSVGNTVDPEESYKIFRGKAASSDALMRARSFPVTE